MFTYKQLKKLVVVYLLKGVYLLVTVSDNLVDLGICSLAYINDVNYAIVYLVCSKLGNPLLS
jgi:uncharacterized protein YkvS